jgi:hypothetical protein
MIDVAPDQLQRAVEDQHGCKARLARIEAVELDFEGEPVWEGAVHVFDITGHPKAKRAYAWSSPIDGSTKRRFYAVLELPPVTSAQDAVRAAIVADNRGKG